tara:strand:- start:5550 stop:5984 length:435 start_codon:yes stop_codon:yes gene_type:complete
MKDVFTVKRSADGDDVLKSLNGHIQNVISVSSAADYNLEDVESGSVIVLTKGGVTTVTLPAASKGLNYRIIMGSAQNHVIDGGATLIQGDILDFTNATTLARTSVANKSSITTANTAIGDHLDFLSDGVNWYVTGLLNDTPTLA